MLVRESLGKYQLENPGGEDGKNIDKMDLEELYVSS
jgi:hypothetical protein